ncbi:N-methylhydantoinase A/oxoprolinase/acetone carboxylase beta subunit [Evansella vedderi]|uniref:N-methylhydantoinase A/oxoprolinase/acetone carboxylase beta subunit n=1 Tax=Evansella vedderi TaxID=38282 RepID=A0ABT9ZNH8_9BACI|nr:hydantoinase/oxoprolinase family protein [Evansella vedderi]MDQ0252793.1 N-methylhydantoinase A/oxoprolinase/acetone carboxylase beta subunit [Evansella vedderi]
MGNYRIGIDVGGTHTDAVILDDQYNVISETKEPTTEDVSTGIYKAVKKIIDAANVPKEEIKYAMLGTTHCTNAIVERKRLNKVAVIRIGAPATLGIKPLVGVPNDLREILGKYVYIVRGGNEFDGREIAELDKKRLSEIANELKGKVDSIAITSVFSPVSTDHEHEAQKIFQEVLGDEVAISLSSEIGSVGLLERENATILNAAVVNVARSTANGFVNALKEEGVNAKVFFGQNDGTLMSVEYTVKYPILTIACGPTNSIRGASYLTNQSNALVVDVGGTTTDIGVLVNSFPRQSSLAVEIGGVRTNFRMPDITSVGIGGGTIVRVKEDGTVTLGPDSVGYRLQQEAYVFGGNTLTTTDIIVAKGMAEIGDVTKVVELDKDLVEKAYHILVEKVEEAIDRMKTSAEPIPVILVGGGSVLLPEKLKGASIVHRPDHFGVANAIGSAISQVSGQVERVFALDELGRTETLELAKQMAKEEAVVAGADANKVEIVDFEDVPLAYLPGNATRIRAKAAGPLAE